MEFNTESKFLILKKERNELIDILKLYIKSNINTSTTTDVNSHKYDYIKNIDEYTESEIDDLVNSIYSIVVIQNLEIVNILKTIFELSYEQELQEAMSHGQYMKNETKINRLQIIIYEIIRKKLPIKFQSNKLLIENYIYDMLNNNNNIESQFSNLIININLKNNEICNLIC